MVAATVTAMATALPSTELGAVMKRIFTAAVLGLTAAISISAHAHSAHGDHAPAGHAHAGHGTAHEQAHAGHVAAFPHPTGAAAPEGVSVSDCWIRAMPGRLPSAAYFRVNNAGAHEVVLIGAQADGFERVMLHGHETTDGMARMVHADRVVIAAGSSFEFAPRGHHVMLEKPSAELVVGTQRPITLWFEGDRALTLPCEVRPARTLQ